MPDFHAVAVAAAKRNGIDPNLFVRQINQESGFNPNARSSAGAIGIAQIVPHWHPGVDATDPVASLNYAAHLMGTLYREYGDYQQALSVYNSGKPDAYKDPGFSGGQTYNYVRDIMGGQAPSPPQSAPTPPTGTPVSPRMGMNALLANSMASTDKLLGIPSVPMPTMPTPRAAPSLGPVAPTSRLSTNAGGFLTMGAPYKVGRVDQGHDFQTAPGGAIIAPGDGAVVKILSDPHGFGPSYPLVHFTTGPYAGKTIYIGHTLAALPVGGKFRQGQTISFTGRTPIGNASVPGWAEIGFATGGVPGGFGQAPPF